MIYLRQSTASQEVPLGYFVDSTDGNTEETALSIANTDIKVWKTGATTLANKNSGGATHISNGIYYAVLDATDTDTIGPLVLFCHVSGALTVRLECCVLDEAVYDVQFGTTAPATATNITAGTITTATNVTTVNGLAANVITAASMNADASAEIADAVWDEALAGHAGAGSAGEALSAAGTAGDPWTTALPGAYGAGTAGKIIGDNINATISSRASQTSVDTIDDFLDTEIAAIKAKTDNLPAAPAATGDIPTVGAIADAVWDEAKSGHTTAGTYGQHFGAATESATVNDAGATTTAFITTLASAVDDHYIGRVIIFTSGTLLNQATDITDYVGATKTVTVTALTSAPANGVSFLVV